MPREKRQTNGSRKRNGISWKLRELLSDGEWHTKGELVSEVATLIRPQVAARIWFGGQHHKDQEEYTDTYGLDYVIYHGRMRVITQALRSIGTEWRGEPGLTREYRLAVADARQK